MTPESKRPVTLEDLLRLKRAERPAPEFWESFDRELRAKQLAALVERPPWWRDLPRVFSGFPRFHVPLGAAAVLAITFLSVRDYEPAARAPEPLPAPVADIPAMPAAVQYAVVATNDEAVAPAELARQDSASAPAVAHSSEATSPVELSPLVPLIGGASLEFVSEEVTPSGRAIAENLATVQAAEPVIARSLLATTSGFEGRAMPPARVSTVVDPLQQMTPPSERRIARILAVSASTEAPVRLGERYGSKLPDEKLYERGPRRIGGAGDRLSLKL